MIPLMERPRELVWMVFVRQLKVLKGGRFAVLVFQMPCSFTIELSRRWVPKAGCSKVTVTGRAERVRYSELCV